MAVADALLEAAGLELRCMRDATRGGVASVLNELARSWAWRCSCARRRCRCSRGGGRLELSGIDPMYVANEGKLVAVVSPERAEAALVAMPEGAADIGEVKTEPPGMVLVETGFGGRRVMDQLVGDPLPRIC